MNNQSGLDKYVLLFSKLRTDATSNWTSVTNRKAPHKPFLLLSVMDLFSQGNIRENFIEINPDLGSLFSGYWSKVMPPEKQGNLFLPFFHLKTSGFWELIPQIGKSEALQSIRQIGSLRQLQNLVSGARLNDDLYSLLCITETRDVLRAAVIKAYFAPEIQSELIGLGIVNQQAFEYSKLLIEKAMKQVKDETNEDYQPVVRDQGFRRAIVRIYDHRCAVCGLKMLTPDGHSVVDAAHIVPWSISHHDSPTNGLALCRLCHWTFDEGMITVSSHYTLMLSPELTSSQNLAGHLLTLQNRPIIMPTEVDLYPSKESIEWHRLNTFLK